MLEAEEDIYVTTEAGTVREAIDEADRTRPDVVVMDVRFADGSGIEATREIRDHHPDTKVLMLTSFADDEALFSSIMAGASGYVLKQVRSGDLVRAIRAVGAGESLLDPSVTTAVLERLRKGKHLMRDERLARLSPQEERILTLVADGRTNREIGDELNLAEKTVKNYVSSDPLQARGGASSGSGRLPRPPHDHPRFRRLTFPVGVAEHVPVGLGCRPYRCNHVARLTIACSKDATLGRHERPVRAQQDHRAASTGVELEQ